MRLLIKYWKAEYLLNPDYESENEEPIFITSEDLEVFY